MIIHNNKLFVISDRLDYKKDSEDEIYYIYKDNNIIKLTNISAFVFGLLQSCNICPINSFACIVDGLIEKGFAIDILEYERTTPQFKLSKYTYISKNRKKIFCL